MSREAYKQEFLARTPQRELLPGAQVLVTAVLDPDTLDVSLEHDYANEWKSFGRRPGDPA